MGKLQPYLFIAPAGILLIAVFAIPTIWAIGMSLFEYNLIGTDRPFVGLDNYINLLTNDRVFWRSVRVTIVWTFISVSLEYVIALVIAVLLNEAGKLRGGFRAVTALPWAVPPVIAALIWSTMYDPHIGVLNQVLQPMGLIRSPKTWLAEPGLVLPSLIAVVLWKYTPFMILALLAGLQSIPEDLYDAAAVDGANLLQRFRYVTLPLLMPVTTVVLTLGVIWRAKHFDIVWALTKGGPGSTSELLTINAYRRVIMSFQAGVGSAVAVILAIGLLGFMIYMLRRMVSITD
jgi:ABC-type sugar transport system permease subunit